MAVGCSCLLLFVIVSVVSGAEDVKKKVNDEVRLNPGITESLKDKTITWKYTGGGEVIKVIEYDHDFKTLESLNPKFKDRVDLNMITGELTLRDLKMDQTGLYSIEINNQVKGKTFKLTVMEPVTKPILKKEPTDNPAEVMYLICEYNSSITWNCSEGKSIAGSPLEKPRIGESLTFKKSGKPQDCCTCTLKNDVSSETSVPICEKDLFTAGSNIGEIIGALIAVFCILIIIITFVLYMFCDPVHNFIYNGCKDKPCLKEIISCLESCRKTIKSQSKDDAENQHEGEHLKKVNNEQKPEDSEPTGQ